MYCNVPYSNVWACSFAGECSATESTRGLPVLTAFFVCCFCLTGKPRKTAS